MSKKRICTLHDINNRNGPDENVTTSTSKGGVAGHGDVQTKHIVTMWKNGVSVDDTLYADKEATDIMASVREGRVPERFLGVFGKGDLWEVEWKWGVFIPAQQQQSPTASSSTTPSSAVTHPQNHQPSASGWKTVYIRNGTKVFQNDFKHTTGVAEVVGWAKGKITSPQKFKIVLPNRKFLTTDELHMDAQTAGLFDGTLLVVGQT
jgi:hypothetical protein